MDNLEMEIYLYVQYFYFAWAYGQRLLEIQKPNLSEACTAVNEIS